MPNAVGDPLSIARALSPLVEREAASAEAAGTLPQSLVDAFRDSGLFALQIPRALGGFEADAETSLAVYEEVCRADGSAGWTLLANASTSAFATTYTSDEAVRKMFASGIPTHAGQFSPRGRAVSTDDGYTVSGRYSFGSGSAHADWVGGGALEVVDGEPRMLASGRPAIKCSSSRGHVEFAGNWTCSAWWVRQLRLRRARAIRRRRLHLRSHRRAPLGRPDLSHRVLGGLIATPASPWYRRPRSTRYGDRADEARMVAATPSAIVSDSSSSSAASTGAAVSAVVRLRVLRRARRTDRGDDLAPALSCDSPSDHYANMSPST